VDALIGQRKNCRRSKRKPHAERLRAAMNCKSAHKMEFQDFKTWLKSRGKSEKLARDIACRCRQLERITGSPIGSFIVSTHTMEVAHQALQTAKLNRSSVSSIMSALNNYCEYNEYKMDEIAIRAQMKKSGH